MGSLVHDFDGYEVVVVGGSRGVGHAIAQGFADGGAHVTVTGTMMLPDFYDTDLRAFDYDCLNLARQSSIDNFVSTIRHIDVLVLAAGANLPYGLPDSERHFVTEAVRSGILGPRFLTTRLRLKLGQSPVMGGGCVITTGATRRWYELVTPDIDASARLVADTERAAANYAGIGVRVNSVLEPARGLLPRQQAPAGSSHLTRGGGDTLVRSQQRSMTSCAADTALFLASESAGRINGQTIRLS